jgi:3-deoxy-D-manno-octulosonic-acid transferase
MILLYDFIFIVFVIFSLPVYLFRGKFHSGLLLRLGIIPREMKERLTQGKNIWVHAVSVGEANAVSGLVEKLRRQFPGEKIVISTVTSTGNRLVRSLAGSDDTVIYLPLDLSFITDRFVALINPALFITTETELWPNLITSLSRRNVPIVLVNGRISLGSFRGYRLVEYFMRRILGHIKLFCMQSEGDGRRIIALGADPAKVKITGNMKFDMSLSSPEAPDKNNAGPDYARELQSVLGKDFQLLVAGSTHSGEEEIILRIYGELLSQFSHLRLLIAPRHIERACAVEKMVEGSGLSALRLSRLAGNRAGAQDNVFILDTIGQLKSLYEMATIVFVGGSLVKKGGHNIIEPAFFGKPVIVGPYMFNFKDITKAFLDENAVIKVADEMEFLEEIRILLLSQSQRETMGRLCQRVIKDNRGATDLTLGLIKKAVGEIK